MSTAPKFYRHQDQSAIAGVASATARLTGMPILLTRILYIVSIFLGPGIPFYFLLWFFSPKVLSDGRIVSARGRVLFLGALLLFPALAVFLFEVAGLAEFAAFLTSGATLFGLGMLRRSRTAGLPERYLILPEHEQPDGVMASGREVVGTGPSRETPEKMLAGVCAHVAAVTGMNVQFLRLLVIVLSVIPATFPAVPVIYGASIFLLPRVRSESIHEV